MPEKVALSIVFPHVELCGTEKLMFHSWFSIISICPIIELPYFSSIVPVGCSPSSQNMVPLMSYSSFNSNVISFASSNLNSTDALIILILSVVISSEEEYDYVSMTKAELVELAEKRKLSTSGNKKKLIERLENSD